MIVAIVQARLTSERLPNKVLLMYNGKTVIEHIHDKLKQSKQLSKIFFAIPSNKRNSELKNYLKKKNIPFILGPEKNVLKRFYKVCAVTDLKIIVRITADCPLIDFRLVDKMIKKLLGQKKIDLLSNSITRTFPDGLDIEIFNKEILIDTYKKVKKIYDKEHVTPFMIRNYRCFDYKNTTDLSYKRWTLDTKKDHSKINKIFKSFKDKRFFFWKEILKHGF